MRLAAADQFDDDDAQNVPRMATVRASCLYSGIERSMAASKIYGESMLKAAFAFSEAQ